MKEKPTAEEPKATTETETAPATPVEEDKPTETAVEASSVEVPVEKTEA